MSKRTARLAELYRLRLKVDAEIAAIEAAVTREAEDARRIREQAERSGTPIPLRRVAVCGTDGGYHKHRRTGEVACEPCTIAHRLTERERRERRAAAVAGQAEGVA